MIEDYCLSVHHDPGYVFEIDPDETVDYAFDWNAALEDGETISTSSFVLPDGLTQVSAAAGTTRTAIFVSGASCGRIYRITNRVTTSGGRTFDQTICLKAREH